MNCPFAKDCVKYCYAQKGAYSWSNVKPAFEKRYELTKDSNFVQIMTDAIKAKKATHIRIHDSGDFYSNKYILYWFTIAINNPNVVFYFYTKSIALFEGIELPKNMFSIYSYGSKNDSLINKAVDRHAVIFKSLEELRNAGYTDCSNNDLAIMKTKKVGLILH
jgi:DNA repair photolyase